MTESLVTLNKKRWDACRIPADKGPAFKAVAERLSAPEARKRYDAVSKATRVPWWFIAVVHQREASQKWDTFLGNGQKLNKKTTIIPKGRGPFATWEEGAVDALVNCPPYAARNKDWSIGGALTMLEKYNGLGYANKGLPSPYVWAGTNQYVKGKYVSDGKYDPNHVDTQLGCAGLLKFMGVFKDNATPVLASAAIGGGLLYSTWDFIQAHPYSMGLTALAVGFLSWAVIHSLINKKNIENV